MIDYFGGGRCCSKKTDSKALGFYISQSAVWPLQQNRRRHFSLIDMSDSLDNFGGGIGIVGMS